MFEVPLWLSVCLSGQNPDVECVAIPLEFRLVCLIISALLASANVNWSVRWVWMHLVDGEDYCLWVCRQRDFSGLQRQPTN